MRFWTALQHPLHQAALVEQGRIVRTIPDHVPKTPARMVGPIGEWDEKHFLVGRRNSVELWTRDGKTLVQQVYHPWIYGLHVLRRHEDKLLIGSAGLDCLFLLDWDGNVCWDWWAYKDGRSASIDGYPVAVGDTAEWKSFQLTQNFKLEGSCHLNSAQPTKRGTYLATLCHRREAVEVDPRQAAPSSRLVAKTGISPHDYQLDERSEHTIPVVGLHDGLQIGSRLLQGGGKYTFVKRIRTLPHSGRYAFSYEQGVALIEPDGHELWSVTLPRPWHIECLEA